jgi:sigma-B regulation protein RsbQ
MVFAHGLGCDQNMWRFVTPAFADEYKIVLFDIVGMGGSDFASWSASTYSSMDAYADDVLDIIDELDLRDVIFVGHSVSGTIGALAAIQQPDRFAKLVMIGPSPCYIDDEASGYVGGFSRDAVEDLLAGAERDYIAWAIAMAPLIMGNPDRPELAAELTALFCRADPIIAAAFARVIFLADVRQQLVDVSVPTLVLQCAEDVIAPDVVGEYVASKIPDATLVRMKATGHCPNLSAPDETIDAIRAFL